MSWDSDDESPPIMQLAFAVPTKTTNNPQSPGSPISSQPQLSTEPPVDAAALKPVAVSWDRTKVKKNIVSSSDEILPVDEWGDVIFNIQNKSPTLKELSIETFGCSGDLKTELGCQTVLSFHCCPTEPNYELERLPALDEPDRTYEASLGLVSREESNETEWRHLLVGMNNVHVGSVAVDCGDLQDAPGLGRGWKRWRKHERFGRVRIVYINPAGKKSRCKSELSRVLPGVNLDTFNWCRGVFEDDVNQQTPLAYEWGQKNPNVYSTTSFSQTSSSNYSSCSGASNYSTWLRDAKMPSNVTMVNNLDQFICKEGATKSEVQGKRGVVKVHPAREPRKTLRRGESGCSQLPLERMKWFASSNLSSCNSEQFRCDVDQVYHRVYGNHDPQQVSLAWKKNKTVFTNFSTLSRTDLTNLKKAQLVEQTVAMWCRL